MASDHVNHVFTSPPDFLVKQGVFLQNAYHTSMGMGTGDAKGGLI
jgi:hypothetical protein